MDDWNAVWSEKMRSNLESKGLTDRDVFWNDPSKARNYDRHVSADNWSRGRKTMTELGISKGDSVIDIGCGTGALVIPLLQSGVSVTALDASGLMLDICREHVDELGLSGVSFVEKRWEDVDAVEDLDAPFDHVVASFSLGMLDIGGAVEKMVSVCSGTVSLYWFARETESDKLYMSLWPSLHGIDYVPGPKLNVLLNTLFDIGITPSMQTFSNIHVESYDSAGLAAEAYAPRMNVDTGDKMRILKKMLADAYGDSPCRIPTGFIGARLWWDV